MNFVDFHSTRQEKIKCPNGCNRNIDNDGCIEQNSNSHMKLGLTIRSKIVVYHSFYFDAERFKSKTNTYSESD